jgi:hypothetical protein
VLTVEGSTVTFPVFGEVTCPAGEFEDGGVITLPGGMDCSGVLICGGTEGLGMAVPAAPEVPVAPPVVLPAAPPAAVICIGGDVFCASAYADAAPTVSIVVLVNKASMILLMIIPPSVCDLDRDRHSDGVAIHKPTKFN